MNAALHLCNPAKWVKIPSFIFCAISWIGSILRIILWPRALSKWFTVTLYRELSKWFICLWRHKNCQWNIGAFICGRFATLERFSVFVISISAKDPTEAVQSKFPFWRLWSFWRSGLPVGKRSWRESAQNSLIFSERNLWNLFEDGQRIRNNKDSFWKNRETPCVSKTDSMHWIE